MMQSFGVEQHRLPASHEIRPCAADFPGFGVFGYRAKGDVGRLLGCGKVVAQADEIEVGRNKDKSAPCAGFVAAGSDVAY